MRVIAELLQEIPAAAKYRPQLEALQAELDRLKVENTELRRELAQFIDRWETLDGDAVSTLLFLARSGTGNAFEIAQANTVNIQIVEAYLRQLVRGDYVCAHANGAAPRYGLADKGRWYLKERGLLRESLHAGDVADAR